MAVAHRIYAEALLAAAKEKGRLDRVRRELGELVAGLDGSAELRAFLRNPQIEPHVKRDALEGALGDADELVRNFLLLVAEKGRIAEIQEIQAELERLIAREALGSADARRLMTVPGVNVICAATFLAAIGDIRRFHGARRLVAYLGLDPRVR